MAKQVCTNCKMVNDEDARFCKGCGGTSFIDLTVPGKNSSSSGNVFRKRKDIDVICAHQQVGEGLPQRSEGMNCK